MRKGGVGPVFSIIAVLRVVQQSTSFILKPTMTIVSHSASEGCFCCLEIIAVCSLARGVCPTLRSYTPKLHKEDEVRVKLAVSHYERYIDFNTLLRPTS